MTDHPMLFSTPMIQALLMEAREPGTGKTQTRRVLTPQPFKWEVMKVDITDPILDENMGGWGQWETIWSRPSLSTPMGQPDRVEWTPLKGLHIRRGDRMWCREAWHAARSLDRTPPRDIPRDADIEYAATYRSYAEIGLKGKTRPGMFMPRWASRLTLYVSDVRVQRLQEISEADAQAEGVQRDSDGWQDYMMPQTQCCVSAKDSYRTLWEHLNGPGSWEANPWVYALTFRPVLGNIDTLPATLEEHP